MTTEETELTFVRCPSCRSLIPAIATRCRMCGAQFEKKAEPQAEADQDSGDAQKRSRVRQRTISASSDDVDQIKRQLHEEKARGVPADAPDDLESDDIPMARTGSFRAAPVRTVEDEEADFSLDENKMRFRSSREEEPEQEVEEPRAPIERNGRPKQTAEVSAPIAEEEHEEEWNEEADEEHGFEDGDDEDSADDSSAQPSFARPEGKRRRRRRRRKRGQNSPDQVNAGQQQPVPSRNTPPLVSQPPMDALATQVARTPSRQPEPEAPIRNEEFFQDDMQEHQNEAPRRQAENSSRAADHATQSPGDLVGWFVDYSGNARGSGIEVRSGRFFIGRQKLRNGDMLLSDSSISTPHCMVTSAPGESLHVQDLMSERGTYVKRAGSDVYAPVTNTISLEHGDWLKLGEYEVLVCFVPRGPKSRK